VVVVFVVVIAAVASLCVPWFCLFLPNLRRRATFSGSYSWVWVGVGVVG